MTTRASSVLDFSGVQSGIATGKLVLDWEKNRDSDGNEKTQFLPEETVFLLFQPAKDARLTDKKSSLVGGNFQTNSPVTRTVEEDVQFSTDKPTHSVQYRPSSNLATAVFDGRTPQLTVNSQSGTITASRDLPAIGTLSYKAQFIALSFKANNSLLRELEERQNQLGQDEQAQYKVLLAVYDDAEG